MLLLWWWWWWWCVALVAGLTLHLVAVLTLEWTVVISVDTDYLEDGDTRTYLPIVLTAADCMTV